MSEQKTLRWTHPGKNTAGETITRPLDWELGVVVDGEIQPLMSVVGESVEDNVYTAPLDQSVLTSGASYTLQLRAIDRLDLDDPEDDLYGAWSNPVEFVIPHRPPVAPTNFTIV